MSMFYGGQTDYIAALNALVAGTGLFSAVAIDDANFNLDLNGGNPRITFDSGDYLEWNRAGNYLQFPGGVVVKGAAFDPALAGNRTTFYASGQYGGGVSALDGSTAVGFFAVLAGTEMRFFVGQGAGDTVNSKVAMQLNAAGLGIGTTPSYRLHASGSGNVFLVDGYGETAAAPGTLFRKAEGTPAAPSAVSVNSFLGGILCAGYTSAGAFGANVGAIAIKAAEAFTATNQGTYISFETTATGATSRAERMRIDASGNVGIGVSTFGTSAAGVFAVKNGTAPTSGPADTVQFYSSDDAAGHTVPSFYCEGTNVVATGQADSASSVRVKMRINGTVRTFLCI